MNRIRIVLTLFVLASLSQALSAEDWSFEFYNNKTQYWYWFAGAARSRVDGVNLQAGWHNPKSKTRVGGLLRTGYLNVLDTGGSLGLSAGLYVLHKKLGNNTTFEHTPAGDVPNAGHRLGAQNSTVWRRGILTLRNNLFVGRVHFREFNTYTHGVVLTPVVNVVLHQDFLQRATIYANLVNSVFFELDQKTVNYNVALSVPMAFWQKTIRLTPYLAYTKGDYTRYALNVASRFTGISANADILADFVAGAELVLSWYFLRPLQIAALSDNLSLSLSSRAAFHKKPRSKLQTMQAVAEVELGLYYNITIDSGVDFPAFNVAGGYNTERRNFYFTVAFFYSGLW